MGISGRLCEGEIPYESFPPPGQLFTLSIVPTTDSATVTYEVRGDGGPVLSFQYTELTPTEGAIDVEGIAPDVDEFEIVNLVPDTVYTFRLFAHGHEGSYSFVDFQVVTEPEPAAPSAPTFRAVAGGGGDNVSSFVINKPTGTLDGDLMVMIYTQVDGTVDHIQVPVGWAEDTRAHNGDTPAGFHGRLFTKIASSEGASYTIGADASAASTRADILSYSGANFIDVVNVGINLGTGTGIIAPAVTPTQDNTLLVTVHQYLPNPFNAARTMSVADGRTERVDAQSPLPATGHGIYESAGPAAGVSSGAKTATVNAAILLSHSLTFCVGQSGDNPSVTAVTASVDSTDPDDSIIEVTAVTGNYDSLSVDPIGIPNDTITDADGVFDITVARQSEAVDAYLDIRPSKNGAQSNTVVRFGPYVIPAFAASLPSQTPASGNLNLSINTTTRDKDQTGLGHAVSGTVAVMRGNTNILPANSGTLPKIINCNIDGLNGQQGLFGSLYIEDVTIERWGSAINLGDPVNDPDNGHAAYVRQGVINRLTILESANRTGSAITSKAYSLHARAGTLTGGIWLQINTLIDQSAANAVIGGGGARVNNTRCVNIQKENGLFIIGGISGGNHDDAEFIDCVFDNLRLMGNWAVRLKFTNCTYNSLTNNAVGVLDLAGLTQA